jgi:hypothetical protein
VAFSRAVGVVVSDMAADNGAEDRLAPFYEAVAEAKVISDATVDRVIAFLYSLEVEDDA